MGDNSKSAKIIIGAQIFTALLVVNALIRGITLSVLWGWFIAPLGVRDINVTEAIGIGVVFGFLTAQLQDTEKDRKFAERFGEGFIQSLASCAFALVLGWIVHLFV